VPDRELIRLAAAARAGGSPGCLRLAAGQAAEDQARRDRVPGLIAGSEDPAGAVQRHRLTERIEADLGQMLTWRLSWQHDARLTDDQRGNCQFDITPVTRQEAGQIAARLAARDWPPDAAKLPWVVSPYPER